MTKIRIENPHFSGFRQSTPWIKGLEVPGLSVGEKAVIIEMPEEGVTGLRESIRERYPAVTVEIVGEEAKAVNPFQKMEEAKPEIPEKDVWMAQCTARKKKGTDDMQLVTIPDGNVIGVKAATHMEAKSVLYDSLFGGET